MLNRERKAINSSSSAEKWELLAGHVCVLHLPLSALEVSTGRVNKFYNLRQWTFIITIRDVETGFNLKNMGSDHSQAHYKTVHRPRSSTNDHMEGRTEDQRLSKNYGFIHSCFLSSVLKSHPIDLCRSYHSHWAECLSGLSSACEFYILFLCN